MFYLLSCLYGAVAQLGERLVRNQEVRGSIPRSSTNIITRIITRHIILKICAVLRHNKRTFLYKKTRS